MEDSEAEVMHRIDVLWVAARCYKGHTWGRSDGEYFVNAMSDLDSDISQWSQKQSAEPISHTEEDWDEDVHRMEMTEV